MWRKVFEFVRRAAITAVLRKIFIGIIDHFGWGPILTAFVLSVGAAVVARLASLEWYWVLGSSLVIFVIGLTLATVLAGRYRREERVAVKASPNWEKGEIGRFFMPENEEEIFGPITDCGDRFNVDLRWWPKDKVFCEIWDNCSVRCQRASDTALHEGFEIRFEIWTKQNGER